MWCELYHLPSYRPHASTFEIHLTEGEDSESETDPLLSALTGMDPRRVWHLAAFQGGKEVGGCILNVTTGAWGVGGLFDMWVMPKARKQGIGTALAHTTCELARQLGCHHVVLNATEMGKPVYQRVGFESMGYGFTWYVHENVLAQPAPSDDQVRLLEALGLGDLKTLDERGNHFATIQLQQPTLNGWTPLEIAVRCQQPTSAAWLVEHGVIPDILSAWDLGWKERVPALLAEHPELVRRRGGRWNATPLHTAIERNDLELAKLLLIVPNDLESKDEVFQATPMGWARHFQRSEMITLLEQERLRHHPF
jgi:GNAT superfamily N-acetyltransferase